MDELLIEIKAQEEWEKEQEEIANKILEDESWRQVMCNQENEES